MSQYRYSPLSQKPNVIRLLRLLPSKGEPEIIRGELFEYPLRESDAVNHPYEALSYVWGDEKNPESITIKDNQNGCGKLAVTRSLFTALLHLRDHELPRTIWVDAISINQADEKEKERQIQYMAAIYAKASRVIVWLGEAQANSDQALEAIRVAAENSMSVSKTGQLEEQAIRRLLERPWFHRIWVLQEVAAARHVMIICGSTEIDGHTFCLGLEFLNTILEDSLNQITFLIRGAIFRSRHVSRRQGRLSLHICSLGELIDMYQAYAAKIHHDKIFALLGMSSDDLSVAGLEPDYNVPWSELMRSLVKFLVSDASVDTRDDSEMAVIKSKGRVLGQVFSITHKQENRRHVQIAFQYMPRNLEHNADREISWSLPSQAKSIEKGDLICLLQGALKPTIVRPCKDYFAIIMMVAVPLEHIQAERSNLLQSEKSFLSDFLLVWDWGNSSEKLLNPDEYNFLLRTDGWQLEQTNIRMEGQMGNAIRIWNVAQILGDSGAFEEAEEMRREVTEVFKAVKEEHVHSLECQCGLIPLLLAAENGYDVVVHLLLAKDGIDLNLKDYLDRTPLSRAAENGHEAVVKLLLVTGKVDVDSKDKNGRTPFSWAAGNGHEAVIKLLLATSKVDVDLEDVYNRQTPLSWAAKNGHETVIKLLLATGKVDVDSKDYNCRTPLSWAAGNGYEAVIKLLIVTGKADVNSKDYNDQTPLSRAAENGHDAVVKLLLATGKVDVDSKGDHPFRTPLSRAAENGHDAVVKLLLATGKIDVNSKDNNDYRTSLWWAAENGHEAVVKLLESFSTSSPPTHFIT